MCLCIRVYECEKVRAQHVYTQPFGECVLKSTKQTSLLSPAADPNMKQPIRDLYLIAGQLVLATHCHALPKTGTVALGQGQGHTHAYLKVYPLN